MPFYEFYCADCHTRFNFFARRVTTDRQPDCPRCGRPRIERVPSLFAISRGRPEPTPDPGEVPADLDEARLERAMAAMAGEFEGLDEEDPRAMGRLLRRLYASTGMRLGEGMEEALRRMEAGEDPERLEAELGDALERETPLQAGPRASLRDLRRRYLPPRQDPQLYEL